MPGNVIYTGGPETGYRDDHHMRHARSTVPPLHSVITITEATGAVSGGQYRVVDVLYPIEGDRSYFEVYASWEPAEWGTTSSTDVDGNEPGLSSR